MFNQPPPHSVQTNRLPLFIGFMILLLILGFLMLRNQMKQNPATPSHKPYQSMDIPLKAEGNNWFNEDKFKNIKIIGHKDLTPREIQQEAIARQETAAQQRQTQEQKKLELAAAQSPLAIDVPAPPGAITTVNKSSVRHDGFATELNNLMDMVKSVAGGGLPDLNHTNNSLDAKQAFLKPMASDHDDYLENHKTKPRSVYEIRAGTYIPAALITGINADLPGNVNAQVTENVYDTTTGNYLLVPQGTKLVGEYNSQIALGQNRVQVVWKRLIFPDGSSLDLDKMQGVDISGTTGLHDKVDNHYLRIYGNALLLSFMGTGYDLLNNRNNTINGQLTVQQALAAQVGQKMAEVSDKSLEKNMDVQPTLIIQSGYKFKIFVLKDIVLEAIQDVKITPSYAA